MSQLTMMYLRDFFVVAQLTILFGFVMSFWYRCACRSASKAHRKYSFATFVDIHFLTVGHVSDIGLLTKLKGTGCYSQVTDMELLATRRGTMSTAMLSRSPSQGRRCSYVLTRK
jgi:hypothetical protein